MAATSTLNTALSLRSNSSRRYVLPVLMVCASLAVTHPLYAQRARRSSGTHTGIPCGHTYISASKVCHVAAATSDSATDSVATAHVRSASLTASVSSTVPSPATAASTDLDVIRRERDSLRIVVATLKQVCTPPSHN